MCYPLVKKQGDIFMPKFGKASLERRAMLCNDLKRLVDKVIEKYDFSIIETFRDKETQEKYYRSGNSKAKFGDSAHNYHPSFAMDVYPYPVPKKQVEGVIQLDSDSLEWERMTNYFKSVASELWIEIECGIDWKSFKDKPHIQLKDWKERVKNI